MEAVNIEVANVGPSHTIECNRESNRGQSERSNDCEQVVSNHEQIMSCHVLTSSFLDASLDSSNSLRIKNLTTGMLRVCSRRAHLLVAAALALTWELPGFSQY